jgi:hypothetical protein
VHPVAHVTMNEYNNPSFTTMFLRALFLKWLEKFLGFIFVEDYYDEVLLL